MANQKYLLVCSGESCDADKNHLLQEALQREVAASGLGATVQVVKTGCFGFCAKGPVVKILPEETLYVEVQPSDAAAIVQEHLVAGKPVARLCYDQQQSKLHAKLEDIDFYQKQVRIVLRNCGVIDPDSIDEYITRDGYVALEKVLFEMTPEDVITELRKSDLRGRGGAGFPTWRKWEFTRQVTNPEKYVMCNADEGDPGAYMDRSTLEGDPHSILEAMMIAGYTCGSSKGIIYIRAEYPLAIARLKRAIRQAKEYGLMGDQVLGTDFCFDIEIRLGAGAFVCGEETALIASTEGSRGMPRPRPPFPAVKGLWDKPTVINNVETYASIPVIIMKGGDWYARIGTETSKGTKVFALTGKVKNSGLIEVPMGTTLREIVFGIGGGIIGGKTFKAVQTGGPSGGLIPEEYLDTPIDYENLSKLGSIVGSGGMIVMDEDDCVLDVTKFYLDFSVDESCGKCAPCRIGGKTLLTLLDRISKGTGTEDDLAHMKQLSVAMQRASLCGLGQTTPNPVLSIIRHFEDELNNHIQDRHCPAGKCTALVRFEIDPEACIGCTVCARRCPVNCIAGDRKLPHVIDQERCVKCGACLEACKFNAVIKS